MNVQNLFINDLVAFPVIFFINVLFFALINWLQFKQDLKPHTIFDISLINILGGFLIARLLGVIANISNYMINGWSWNPYEGNYLPWNVFNVFDGRFLYSGFLLGVVFSISLMYLYSNQRKPSFFLLDRTFMSFAILLMVNLLVFYLLRTFGIITWTPPVQLNFLGLNIDLWLIQIIWIVLFLLVVSVFKLINRLGMVSITFYVFFGMALIVNNVLKNYVLATQGVNLDSIVAISFFVFAIIEYLQIKSQDEVKSLNENQVKRQILPNKLIPRNYLQSYAQSDRVNLGLPINERLSSTYKYLKRKLK